MVRSILFFLFLFSSFCTFLFAAGAESFDHLSIYKTNSPPSAHPVKETMMINSAIKATASYSYNSKNQLARCDYFRDGKQDGYTLYHYNEKGLNSQILYNQAGKIVEQIFFEVDDKDRVTRYEIRNEKNKLLLHWVFRYNNKGLTSGKRIVDKKVSESFVIDYQKNGDYVQKIYSENNERHGEIYYFFKDGKLFQRKQSLPTGKRQVDYVYNTKGQLTQMIFSASGEKDSVLKKVKVHLLEY